MPPRFDNPQQQEKARLLPVNCAVPARVSHLLNYAPVAVSMRHQVYMVAEVC